MVITDFACENEECGDDNPAVEAITSILLVFMAVIIFLALPTNPIDSHIIMGELSKNLQPQSEFKKVIDLLDYRYEQVFKKPNKSVEPFLPTFFKQSLED